jgi:hypothetical protein
MALSTVSRSFYGMSFDGSQVGTDPPMFDGAVNASGAGLVSDLSIFKSRGARVIIKTVGSPTNYQNADLSFNLDDWKGKVDEAFARIGAAQMHAFVLDGTVMGALLVDDAKEGSAVFGGVPPTTQELDDMAQYHKSKWSMLPTLVRIDNIYLAARKSNWTYLDYAWCQWHERFGNAQTWLTNNVRDGRSVGLGTLAAFNLLNGGSGLTAPWDFSPNHQTGSFGMSPQEIDVITDTVSQQTFIIGALGWSARPNFDKDDYYSMPSIQTALQRLADVCSTRTAGPWNWREHSPSGSTDTDSGGTTVVGNWTVKDDGAGTVVRKNNSNLVPVAPPTNYAAGDLHCILAYARDSERSLLPTSGWSTTAAVSGDSAQGGQLVLLHKIGDGTTEQEVTLQYDSNYAATSQMARWFVLSHNTTIAANLVQVGSAGTWASKTGMGPVPGIASTRSDALVLICAARTDDFGGGSVDENNMSATTGPQQWTRLFMTGTIAGQDAGFFVDYAPTSGTASIDTKSWTQTSGDAAGSGCGFMVAFAPRSIVSGTPPAIQTEFGDDGLIVLSLGSHLSFTLESTGSTPITYSKTSGPSNITLDADTGAFEWTPGAGGTQVIVVQAANDFGTDSQLFTVTVSVAGGSSNAAPVITSPGNFTVPAQQLLAFGVTATDADSDDLTYAIESGPQGAFLDSQTGQFVWVPSGDQGPGTYPIVLRVTDGIVESRSTFTVTVTDVPWTRSRGPRSGFGQVDPVTNQFRRVE